MSEFEATILDPNSKWGDEVAIFRATSLGHGLRYDARASPFAPTVPCSRILRRLKQRAMHLRRSQDPTHRPRAGIVR